MVDSLHLSSLLLLAVALHPVDLGWEVSLLHLHTSAKFLSSPVDLLGLAAAEPLGCDLHVLLGLELALELWLELGLELLPPTSLAATYNVCDRKEG